MTVQVPPGISQQPVKFDGSTIDLETVSNELGLLNLGDFEPLSIKINTIQFMNEISRFDNDWVDYLPRTDRSNNRKGLLLTGLEGQRHNENISLAESCFAAKRKISENEFSYRTDVFNHCESLHPLLTMFEPLGRSFLVKCNTGGYFMPHRDHPQMPRESFRLVVFLNNCEPLQYDWIMEEDRKLRIELGRVYYANTRKVHRTISWVENSIHLIMNIPMTSANVSKVFANLQHRH